jgi:hypothetical protein
VTSQTRDILMLLFSLITAACSACLYVLLSRASRATLEKMNSQLKRGIMQGQIDVCGRAKGASVLRCHKASGPEPSRWT